MLTALREHVFLLELKDEVDTRVKGHSRPAGSASARFFIPNRAKSRCGPLATRGTLPLLRGEFSYSTSSLRSTQC
jgi:hypothetical protein